MTWKLLVLNFKEIGSYLTEKSTKSMRYKIIKMNVGQVIAGRPILNIYLNFHPLEVLSRYRDTKLKVGENTHTWLIWDQTFTHFDV